MKEYCDGCELKLNPENYNIVRFRTLEDEEEIYGSEMYLCPKCLDNIESIIAEAGVGDEPV